MGYDQLINLVASDKPKMEFYVVEGGGMCARLMDTSGFQMEGTDEIKKRVRDYDLQLLYQVYLTCGGSIEEMCAFKEREPKVRNFIPQRATLYKLAKQYHWQEQRVKVLKTVEEDFNKRNPLSSLRISNLAEYMYSMFVKNLMKNAQEGNYGVVKMNDLRMIWEMDRTEKGKAVRVPASLQAVDGREKRQKELLQSIDDAGATRLLKAVKNLPLETRRKFMEDFSGKKEDGVPKLIDRKKS